MSLPEFQLFHGFTIRVAMKARAGEAPTRCLARMLEKLDTGFPSDSMIGYLAIEDDMPAMPRYEVRKGSLVFEAFVPKDRSAEKAYDQLVAELGTFGFEPA